MLTLAGRVLWAAGLCGVYLGTALSYRVNVHAASCFLAIVCLIILGCYVLFKNPRASTSRAFFYLSLAFGAFSTSVFLLHVAPAWGIQNVRTPVWILRNGNLLIPPALFYFTYRLITSSRRFLRTITVISFLTMLPFVILNLFGKYVTEYALVGNSYVPANALTLYRANALTTVSWLIFWWVYILWQCLWHSSGIQRAQYVLFLTAGTFGLVSGTLGYVPAFGAKWFPPFIGVGFVLFPLSLAIAVLRFNMFDVKLVVRRTLPYAFVTSIVGGAYALCLMLLRELSHTLGAMPTGADWIFLLVLVGFGFQPMLEYIQNTIDRLFFREEARLDTFLSRAGTRYGTATTSQSLANLLASDVRESLHLEGTAVFLASRGLVTTAQAGAFPGINDCNHPPIFELDKTDPVLADESGRIDLGPNHTEVSKAFSQANVRAIVPFGSGDIAGALLCKRKLSDLPFNARDATFLRALTTQMEIALGRVQAAASADAAQRLTEAVFESMTNAVGLVSYEGVVLSANRAFEHTFGSAKGRTLSDVGLHGLSLEQLSFGPREIEGPHGVFLATAKKLAGQGNSDSHILVLTDVTELRQLQEVGRRQAALAEIGATVSSINHEISNIISPINHNMEKMLKLDKVEDIKALAQLIGQRLNALESLTRELREYYRDPTITPREVLLKNSIEQVLMDLADIAGSQWIPPETHGLDVQLRADPQKLRQVLLNLCKNAWESMLTKNEKKWSVTARQQDGKVLVSVADSGVGIKADLMPHLYEPFFKTKKEHGSGLGMSIVKRIVEAHGAEIKVTSQEGVGTIVTLSWPAAQNQPIEIR